jgi:potassium-transporting ATPase KdpC subunit
MIRETLNALLACVVTFALCAVAYPAGVYLVGHTLFPRQAEGSLIERDGKTIGSELIAQPFASDKYFSPRPSAAGATGYAADAASGSNLGTTNPALHDRIEADSAKLVAARTGDPALKAALERLDTLQADLKAKTDLKEKTKADEDAIAALEPKVAAAKEDASKKAATLGEMAGNAVPVDLVTTSGSGLDPDLGPEAARYQAPRVAAARGLATDQVLKLIEEQTIHSAAILGAPARVNVLSLNLALDALKPEPAKAAAAPVPTPTTSETPAASPAREAKAEVQAAKPTSVVEAPAAKPDTRVDDLARRIEEIQKQESAEAAELKAVKDRLAGIAAKADEAAGSAKRVGEIDDKVVAVRREVEALRAEAKPDPRPNPAVVELARQVRELQDQLQSLRDSTKTAPAFARVADQFRAKRYADASTAARELTRKYPDDARGWYLAALANGLATAQWKGETEEFIAKGVEQERAGKPAAAEIDALFADLTKDTGKEWLAYQRARAAKR